MGAKDNLDMDNGGHDNVPQMSAAEEKARDRGWRPEEEWDGEPGEWVDANTFNRMGELMDRISSQSRELKEVKGVISEFKKYNKERDIIALKRAKEQLLAEKTIAYENEEFNRVVQLDEDIKEADRQIASAGSDSGNNDPGYDPFKAYYEDEWIADNSWYKKSVIMRGAADTLGKEYIAEHPNTTPKELFKYVTDTIKEEFPDKFKNPNRDNAAAVGSNKGKGKGNRNARSQLTDEEFAVGTRFVKSGLYDSIEEYEKELYGR